MKKFLILFFCLILTGYYSINRSGFVNKSIENIYFSSVSITDRAGKVAGSGTIIWNKANHKLMVLTAAHVIKGMEKKKKDIHVSFNYSSAITPMKVYKISEEKDLALLIGNSNEKSDGPYVKLAMKSPNIGDDIYVVGSPMGLKSTVTKGIIGNFVWEKNPKRLVYRFSADIFFGNSGGGLFNENGELIGVVVSMSYLQISMFSIMLVPGGNWAVSLEEIRKLL